MTGQIEIYSDGGARGNPGPGACGFIIKLDGMIFAKGSRYLGKVTNNYAEYQGVILALDYLIKSSSIDATSIPINFFMDSELVVRQLEGIYKTKNEILKKLNNDVRKLIQTNNLQIEFKYIPRTKNKDADLLVNKELDKKQTL